MNELVAVSGCNLQNYLDSWPLLVKLGEPPVYALHLYKGDRRFEAARAPTCAQHPLGSRARKTTFPPRSFLPLWRLETGTPHVQSIRARTHSYAARSAAGVHDGFCGDCARRRLQRGASTKRRLRRSRRARPNIWRLSIFKRLIWPSTGPLLHRNVSPALIAA